MHWYLYPLNFLSGAFLANGVPHFVQGINGNSLRPTAMHWYLYPLNFITGAFLVNGVPHFVQGLCGNPFQTPFAKPPGVGESPPLTNLLWGLGNLAVGAVLLYIYWPRCIATVLGWCAVGLGVLIMTILLYTHFSKVRSGKLR